MSHRQVSELSSIARDIRRDSLIAIHAAGSGHPGGALSCADLIAYLLFEELQVEPDRPDRDRLVLSKGHSCPALYAAAVQRGWLQRDELRQLRQLGSRLQGHPSVALTPWAETSTGSLGQGFSVAVGMALGLRHQHRSGRVVAILGDGELQEGQVWEAFMSAAHHQLSNLCAVIDYNKLQSDASNAEIMGLEPIAAKIEAFGWQVLEIDGHDFDDMCRAFGIARTRGSGPSCIIAHTHKGRGVSYMEDSPAWHGSVALSDRDLSSAMHDLGTSSELSEQGEIHRADA